MIDAIYLADGDMVLAEVNGKTLDGQEGYVFLAVDCGSLLASIMEGQQIEVTRRAAGEWNEKPRKRG